MWNILLILSALNLFTDKVTSMECYVCHNQEGNKDKCVKTTMQCLEDQLSCITNISYTIPPYWTPLGDRSHFIWKACISTEECERQKEIAGAYCQREWYMDWRCVECCQGELCNYYVTLSGSHLFPGTFGLLLLTYIVREFDFF
ncbi:Low affinity cationic amino acid transporter [Fasciola gigantica]|uniref:Low affinity cationic amino acid transporter n=1 Tax=Fasciola gigantica TaxID=46835 RepID=A0A504Y5G4_FASGI|nr:Low affinity cationic amino acid transporter [Fasciola gigantica]